jgi:hypothetical protein
MPKPIAMVHAGAASVRSSRSNQTPSTNQRSSRKYCTRHEPAFEQAVGKLKRFKRIALRCEKTAQNYGSFVALAFGFILVKTVHTA